MKEPRHSSHSTLATLVEHGLIDAKQAARFAAVLQVFENAHDVDVWSPARLSSDPATFLAEVIDEHPQVLVDHSLNNAEPVVAMSATDLISLLDAIGRSFRPAYATGREMYARLVRTGPPLEITERGLPPRRQERMSISDALATVPKGKADN